MELSPLMASAVSVRRNGTSTIAIGATIGFVPIAKLSWFVGHGRSLKNCSLLVKKADLKTITITKSQENSSHAVRSLIR